MTASRVRVIEALRNLAAYSFQTVVCVALSAAIGFLTVIAGTQELGSIAQQRASLAAAGQDVWRVQSPTAFSAASCAALGAVDGIHDAGARLHQWSAKIAERPGATIDVLEVTPGYARIGWATSGSPLVAAGADVSTTLGLRPGSTLTLQGNGPATTVELDAVLQKTQRLPAGNQVIVILGAPTSQTTECLVESEPGARSAVERHLMSAFNSQATVTPLLNDEQPGGSPDDRMRARITAWAPVIVSAMLVALFVMVQFARRAEWALYRILGVGRAGLLGMLTVQAAASTWAPYAAGTLAGILLAHSSIGADVLVAGGVTGDFIRGLLTLALTPVLCLGALELGQGPLGWLKGQ
ncbi:hypothetical protein [Microbacterium sp. NPDC058389]|uniref:hypothetical protein n=1 Tax=Microbacterium sp. NPDC058389 TaxID=3346475 RepID=UPI00365B4C62